MFEKPAEAPNTKLQAPEKFQTPKHQERRCWFGYWCLELLWSLDLEACALNVGNRFRRELARDWRVSVQLLPHVFRDPLDERSARTRE